MLIQCFKLMLKTQNFIFSAVGSSFRYFFLSVKTMHVLLSLFIIPVALFSEKKMHRIFVFVVVGAFFKIVILHAMNTISLASILASLYPLHMNNVYTENIVSLGCAIFCNNFYFLYLILFFHRYFFSVVVFAFRKAFCITMSIQRLKAHKTYPGLECFKIDHFLCVCAAAVVGCVFFCLYHKNMVKNRE